MYITCQKYALIGTSCVGKTTLVHELENLLKKEVSGTKIEIVEEAAREYFIHNKTEEPFSYFHQSRIQTLAHIQEQIAYFKNPNIILCDRSVLDAVVYVQTNGEKNAALKLLEKEKKWLTTYTHFFLLDPKGVPYKTDDIRKEAKGTRESFHKTFVETLSELKLPHTLISGNLESRLKKMFTIILSEL